MQSVSLNVCQAKISEIEEQNKQASLVTKEELAVAINDMQSWVKSYLRDRSHEA